MRQQTCWARQRVSRRAQATLRLCPLPSGSGDDSGRRTVEKGAHILHDIAKKYLIALDRNIALLALEPMAREFERAAVLRDRTDDIVRDPSGDLRVDLQRHPHRGPDEPDKVRDDLVSDLACITPGTFWIERDRAVKASGSGR